MFIATHVEKANNGEGSLRRVSALYVDLNWLDLLILAWADQYTATDPLTLCIKTARRPAIPRDLGLQKTKSTSQVPRLHGAMLDTTPLRGPITLLCPIVGHKRWNTIKRRSTYQRHGVLIAINNSTSCVAIQGSIQDVIQAKTMT